ncbi:hypothetical protein HR060_00520 [Catenovulum sp. SM1970]|uniref:hypothetical protein n=1 Tax=Marinifaba aquimaris TaxID=2741323 RepID=UPI00157436B1|nr:hypothetical protein [Marinifaba aquimaris]NTS75333.1 hypothetical protein [Marinifaba aquimaris]
MTKKFSAYARFFSSQLVVIVLITLGIFGLAALVKFILFGGYFKFVGSGGNPLSHPFTIVLALLALVISLGISWYKKYQEKRIIQSLKRHKKAKSSSDSE